MKKLLPLSKQNYLNSLKGHLKKMLQHSWPVLALIMVNVIWGATPIVAKFSLIEFPVGVLAFLRFFLAAILLIPFVSVEKKRSVKQSDWPLFVLTAITIVTFHIWFFFEGLKFTRAIDASVLGLLVPILSVLAGWWVLKEKVFFVNVIGVIVGLVGAIALLGIPLILVDALETNILIGNSLIILSSITFVIGAISSKRLLKNYSALIVVFWTFVIGAITFLPLAVIDTLKNPAWVSQITLVGIFGLAYTTLLSSISAYFLFEWAVGKVGVIKADLFQYIQPAVAATLAVPLLNERISFSFIIGTCLIILGVYWGSLGKTEHSHHHLRGHRI